MEVIGYLFACAGIGFMLSTLFDVQPVWLRKRMQPVTIAALRNILAVICIWLAFFFMEDLSLGAMFFVVAMSTIAGALLYQGYAERKARRQSEVVLSDASPLQRTAERHMSRQQLRDGTILPAWADALGISILQFSQEQLATAYQKALEVWNTVQQNTDPGMQKENEALAEVILGIQKTYSWDEVRAEFDKGNS